MPRGKPKHRKEDFISTIDGKMFIEMPPKRPGYLIARKGVMSLIKLLKTHPHNAANKKV